jgi:putative two-component system response regulator
LSANPLSAEADVLVNRPLVLVVDDEEGVRLFFQRLLSAAGFAVDLAVDGESALAAITAVAPDVVLLDVNLPGATGVEVCRRVRRDAATRLTPIILITGLDAREQRIEGLNAGADDFLTKPIDPQELLARVRSLARLKQYTDDLDSAASIIITLAGMVESRDGFSHGHCHRMANYASSLGRALRLGERDLQALYRGGFLHDIGMLAISDAVLRKTGPLDPEEYELVKSHTVVGDALCSNLRSLQQVRPIIRSHHERLDGSGYPDGLRGDEIPVIAQIVGVVDVYEAITTARPYQSPRAVDGAAELLRAHVERNWRRHDIVEAFIDLIQTDRIEQLPLVHASGETGAGDYSRA